MKKEWKQNKLPEVKVGQFVRLKLRRSFRPLEFEDEIYEDDAQLDALSFEDDDY